MTPTVGNAIHPSDEVWIDIQSRYVVGRIVDTDEVLHAWRVGTTRREGEGEEKEKVEC